MVLKNILLFFFCISISINTSFASDVKKFNAMCDLFEDVMKLRLNPKARINYINKNFDSRVGSKEAREAYDFIFQIEPNQRYKVFKQSVESSTKQIWSCLAFKEFFK